jgi:hypothetical protein
MYDFENDLTLSDKNKNRKKFIISDRRSNVYIFSNKKYFKIYKSLDKLQLSFVPVNIAQLKGTLQK